MLAGRGARGWRGSPANPRPAGHRAGSNRSLRRNQCGGVTAPNWKPAQANRRSTAAPWRPRTPADGCRYRHSRPLRSSFPSAWHAAEAHGRSKDHRDQSAVMPSSTVAGSAVLTISCTDWLLRSDCRGHHAVNRRGIGRTAPAVADRAQAGPVAVRAPGRWRGAQQGIHWITWATRNSRNTKCGDQPQHYWCQQQAAADVAGRTDADSWLFLALQRPNASSEPSNCGADAVGARLEASRAIGAIGSHGRLHVHLISRARTFFAGLIVAPAGSAGLVRSRSCRWRRCHPEQRLP